MLGLVWNHKAGSLLQSQTGTRNAAWGTMTKGKKFVYEDSTVKANIFIDGKAILPKSGNRDLPDGVLVISYALGKQGQKTVTFAEDHIAVDIRHEGGFTEYIPMLKGYSDELDIRQGEVRLRRASAGLTITFDKSAKVRTIETKYDSGLRRVVTVCIDSNDTLGYRLIFHQDTAAGK